MMKGLFGLLLVLSLVLFALMQWGGGLTGANKNAQMLAELNPDKIKLLDMPVPMTLTDSAVLPVHSAVAASAPAASAVQPVSAAVPASAPVKTVVVAPLALPVSAVVAAPVVKAAAKSCLEWGEFSGVDLKRATKLLSDMKLGDRLKQHNVEYVSGYWVYIPPLKNKAAVNRKIAEIQSLGVDDYYVVHEPPKLDNVISLGVFKTREAATNYLASLQKKGLRTSKVGERKRKLKFIVFELKNIEAETSAQLHKLKKDFAYSEIKSVPCNN